MLHVERFTVLQALLIIYAELLLFTMSGAFAGVSYVDLIGKSFSTELRRRFFTRKQLISSVRNPGFGAAGAAGSLHEQLSPQLCHPLPRGGGSAADRNRRFLDDPGDCRGGKERNTGYLKTLASIPGVLRSDPNLRIYLFYLNSIGFHVALIPFYVAFAKARYVLDADLAGNLLFFQISGMVAASLLWPRVVRRGGFRAVLGAWSTLSFLLPPAALIIGRFLPLPFYLLLFFLIGAAVSARAMSQEAVTVELSTTENRVLYTGIIGTLNLSIAVFPILIGTLITLIGYIPVFISVAQKWRRGRSITLSASEIVNQR